MRDVKLGGVNVVVLGVMEVVLVGECVVFFKCDYIVVEDVW